MNARSSKPHLGYVLRVFPSLAQTFVVNEILALERLGYPVTVLAMDAAASNRDIEISGAQRRTLRYLQDDGIWGRATVLLWLLRRHPLRLARVLADVASAHSRYLWGAFVKAAQVARQAERDGLDHLHAHLRLGTDAAWLAHRLTGRGFSFTAHSGNLFVAEKSRFIGRELADAAFAVTVCEYNKALMSAREPRTLHKIHVIRPFLSPELFGPRPQLAHASPGTPLRLISVCRLVPKKGVDVLIDAIGLLRERGVSVRTTIVGDGRERPRLAAMIDRLGLGAHVALLGARKPEEVRALLGNADCFVLASVQAPDGDADATPTVLGEAMALGLPLISTRLGGIPEIVPEDTGLLVPPGDVPALADAIAKLSALSAGERLMMGARGREFVRGHWSPERDAERLDELFDRTLGRNADVALQRPLD